MKLPVEVALACLISLLGIQLSLCDVLSDTSNINKWTCTCSSANQGSQNYILAGNCSTSCDCSPAGGGSTGDRWTCICAADGFPKVASDSGHTSCFTACNCTSGSPNEDAPARRKHISSKEKCPIQPPVFSSDKETSCNSATNLISHKINSVPESRVDIGSPINSLTGCFHKASSLFRSKTGTIHETIVQFSYYELENATNKFSNSNLIGVGEAAMFIVIELLSRLHHCHVVPLLGYCSESQGKHAQRLLVFEYMLNGNLRDCLDGDSGKNMDWATRVSIALGAARGLEYLHEAAAPRILHRDVKSTNILLDENWRAKITDLGMAKRLRADGLPSCSNSPARMQGTFGYFAPEYAIVGRASPMSDVFSFGVVLLELISGRKPIHKSTNKGEESLVIWATPRLQDSGRVMSELPDPHLKGNFPEEEMQIMAFLAKECLLLDPDARPTMSEIVQILSTIAPDKSRRRNIPVNFFQSPVDVELRRAGTNKWTDRCSLPLDIDRTLCIGDSQTKAVSVSAEYIERLIIMTSNARSWRGPADETVDLTEPGLNPSAWQMVDHLDNNKWLNAKGQNWTMYQVQAGQ
ncbi:Receptor-like serine/threonine-protein kinase NCRK [Vitis vinifera]|uniref:non-specific serine/threonine protein kinase n=1 Tax=Vitis vinifera TaxID=29760 RepID=A0A438DTL3_VITVI|nr:Receptor-like serine/threonine-protein kinase NCRK [Vitis vinifera]